MKYYKLISNNEFIGIGTSFDMRKFQKKHGIFLVCDESEAQYIQCNGKMYRAIWMAPKDPNAQDVPIIDVIEIVQSDYEALYDAIKSNEEIQIDIEPDITEKEESTDVDESEKMTIGYI